MPEPQNNKISFQKYLFGYFSLASLGALVGLNHLLTIPSDPKNQILFGYSSSRLGLIFFFIVAIISTAYFALKSWRNLRWAQKTERLLFGEIKTTLWGLSISGIVFFIFGLFLLIPSNQFAGFVVFAERLRPFAIYIAQISFQTIIFLRRNQCLDWEALKRELIAHRRTLWIGGGCLAVFAGIWGLISRTGIGIQPNTRTYWYETGVPVLAIQMLFVGIIASAVSHLISWILRKYSVIQEKHSKWLIILLGAGIWGLAAFLWNQAPMPRNTFWAPGPFPPGNAYLPYSDAATFDIYAQFALIGQGIANGDVSVGHNAYIGFLAFLHLLAGQDYALLVGLQVALFAIFPVLVFFIGKIMHGRFLGIFLAGLVIIQELNAIASGGWLNLSHSRFLLSEFPTKIGMAALILLLFLWLREHSESGKNFAYALPLGGILGVLIMVRYNTLAMPFAIIAGIMLIFGKEWRKSLKASLILVLTLFITIAPWMWRSWKLSGDLLIDGGNTHFMDTERRSQALEAKGIIYIGAGISGGEQGALWGPSIMPGGQAEAWALVRPIFEAISAQVEGEPCVAHVGPRGAGHYVKMVHNGIEYGDMQLIAESYDILHRGLGLENARLHEIFAEWNRGELASYLIEITADIFAKKDPETSAAVVDLILDEAAQKGTGKWTSQNALDLGAPTSTINAAVESRIISAYKDERVAASQILTGPETKISGEPEKIINLVRDALYAAKICSYAQGFGLMKLASEEYGYKLKYGEIAKIWRGGCIIRARFLNDIRDAFIRNPGLPNLMIDPEFSQLMNAKQSALRKVVAMAAENGIPALAFSSALAYFDAYRSARLPANLTQAQRDYFGAHTYRRVDKDGSFHTEWQ